MNKPSISKLIHETIYRTKIVQEFTNNEHQIIFLFQIILNQAQLLKFGLFQQVIQLDQLTKFEQAILCVTHPQIYFIENGQLLEYSIFVFVAIQLFFIYWGYILYADTTKEENYIQKIKNEQESSTLKCMILQTWKFIFIFLSDWLGFLLIEGALMILFQKAGTNYFNIITSIIIIIEIVFVMALQDMFLYQSLYFLPQRKNQFIKSTPYILINKLFYSIVLIIFCSEVNDREIILSSIAILISILTLYIYLVIQITMDSITIRVTEFFQSIILYVFLEQWIGRIFQTNSFQFLWLLLIILTIRVLQMNQDQQILIDKDTNNSKDMNKRIFQMKLSLNQFYNLSQKQTSQFKILKKLLLKKHQIQCSKLQCQCRNEDLQMIKIESSLLRTCSYQLYLQTNSLQTANFYIGLIQILVFQSRFFEALNISQMIISSLIKKSGLYKKRSLIREQISLKDQILLTILQQLILIQIRQNITKNKSFNFNYNSVSRAVRQYQQQQDQQQHIINKFDEVIKLKIDILTTICTSRGTLNSSKFNQSFVKAVEKIENFKLELLKKFDQLPTFHNQSLLLFLQIELLNDLINSYTIKNVNTYLEEQDIYASTNLIYQQISQEYSYMKLKILDEENIEIDKLVIKQSFKSIQNSFTDFYDLIPDSLKLIHKYYVRDFFKKGTNRFYLNIDASFIKIKEGIIMPIDICMDFQFDQSTNSLFSTIFMKKSYKSDILHYLLLDSEFIIREITQTLYCQILNFNDKKPMSLLGKAISTIIPNFHSFQYEKDNLLGSCYLTFPTGTKSQDYLYSQEQTFFGTVNVIVKNIGQKARYYLVEIEHLKRYQKTTEIIEDPCYEMEEREVIDHPQDLFAEKGVNFLMSDFTVQQQINLTSRQDSQRALFQSKIEINDNHQIISPPSDNSQIGVQEEKSNKSQNTKNIEIEIEDVGSQISSVAAIRRSAYYPQYQIINSLINSNVSPYNIKKFNIFFCSYLFIVTFNILLLTVLVQQLNVFQEKVTLLSIKYDIYEPIESFLNTRYTIVGYSQAVATNFITQQEFQSLVAFPRSNLVKGYDDLKDKIFDVLIKPEFQSFLEDKYFMSSWYETTKSESERNISFRSGILSLLNYQYSFRLAYTIYSIQTDGPYFFYSYKNYIPIFTIFTELNKNVLNQLLTSLTNQQMQLTFVTAPFQTIAGILSIIYFIYLYKERQLKNKILNILCNQNYSLVQYEIQRLYILQNKIQTHSQMLYRYRLDLIEFDENLKMQEKEYQKLISHSQKLSQKKGRSNIKLYSVVQFLILLVNFSLYCILLFFTLALLNAYIVKMQNTAVIYQELSNSGVDVLIIHAQREVLYRRANILFFKTSDAEDLLDQVDNSLQSIKEISADILKINQDDYLLDDQSFQLFQNVNSQSLCQYLPEEYKTQATTLCPQVIGGVLEQGLISTLQYMYNKIYQEKQINNFTLRNNSQVPIKELEGATFTAKVIKQLVDSLHINLQNQTILLRNNFTLIYSMFIVFSTLVSGIILLKFNQIEKNQINYLRKVVYILPQSIQIFDDSYLRQIKNLIRMGGLV